MRGRSVKLSTGREITIARPGPLAKARMDRKAQAADILRKQYGIKKGMSEKDAEAVAVGKDVSEFEKYVDTITDMQVEFVVSCCAKPRFCVEPSSNGSVFLDDPEKGLTDREFEELIHMISDFLKEAEEAVRPT